MSAKGIDKDLLAALNTVKTGAGKTKLQFAACPAKPAWAIVVAKTVSQKQRDELKHAAGGGTVMHGDVTFEDGKITFVSDAMKQGVAKNLRLGVKTASGKAFAVRGRNEDGSLVDDPDAGGGKGATTMDFGDDEGDVIAVPVSRGDRGIDAEQQIVNQLLELQAQIIVYWDNYAKGLDNFQTKMSFASGQEAEPDHLNTTLKALGKFALDKVLDAAGKKGGEPFALVVDAAKDVTEAWLEEEERVEKAEGQVKIADYIVAVRNSIAARRKAVMDRVLDAKGPILERYQRIADYDFSKGVASREGVVVGDAAQVILDVTNAVAAFRAAVPGPQAFQQILTKNFANTPGMTSSRGGRPSGSVYFSMKLFHEPAKGDGGWSVTEKADVWTLVTSAPEPKRVAESLLSSLDGGRPCDIELPKMVHLQIEVAAEEGMNTWAKGHIFFTSSPSSFEVRTLGDKALLADAWNVQWIRDIALTNKAIEGSAE